MIVTIRKASINDAKALLDIYAYYVANTAITFEYEIPSAQEFENRISATLKDYPYLVAETEGKIVGYIYASRFRPRAAYAWSAQTSVYIHRDYRRLGLGKKLYELLEDILSRQNVTNLYALVASPDVEDEYLTKGSERFHASLGYEQVATHHGCGCKFERWYNILHFEKMLGRHCSPPKPFIPFAELCEDYKVTCEM